MGIDEGMKIARYDLFIDAGVNPCTSDIMERHRYITVSRDRTGKTQVFVSG